MKEVVRCRDCSSCAVGYETGFTGGEVMRCARFDCDVTGEDGCTMGSNGEPSTLHADCDAVLGGHEAVHGW